MSLRTELRNAGRRVGVVPPDCLPQSRDRVRQTGQYVSAGGRGDGEALDPELRTQARNQADRTITGGRSTKRVLVSGDVAQADRRAHYCEGHRARGECGLAVVRQ